ncbi:MAG: hypothetical protein DWH96_10245 [Planctomycetota bacterium]|nr:MAG: hypothetical protein DWH96_10245 [Planctomycetota bacterium]
MQQHPTSTSVSNAEASQQDSFGKRRRRRRAASALPTLMTLGNLVCGFAAIYYASKPPETTSLFGWYSLTVAGVLIFVGMLFDALDGSVARLTRSTSELGAQLDSLADVVTFGVAPAFMMLRLVSDYYGPEGSLSILGPADSGYSKFLWAIAAFYLCSAALRLARFNVEVKSPKGEDHHYFKGLPSPGAGGTVAALVILHQHLLFVRPGVEENLAFARAAALGIPLVSLIVGIGMISSLPYVHFTNQVLRARRGFGSLVKIVLPVTILVWWPQEVLAIGFVLYSLSGPALWLWRKRAHTSLATTATTATTPS